MKNKNKENAANCNRFMIITSYPKQAAQINRTKLSQNPGLNKVGKARILSRLNKVKSTNRFKIKFAD